MASNDSDKASATLKPSGSQSPSPSRSETTLVHSSTPPQDQQQSNESTKEKKGKEESHIEQYGKRLQNTQQLKAQQGLDPAYAGLSLSWQDLSVRGSGSKAGEKAYATTLGTILSAPAALFQKAVRSGYPKNKNDTKNEQPDDLTAPDGKKYILKDLNGTLKAGEMMLVLGRPGAGTTVFLKSVAGLTSGYSGVDGQVCYGDVTGRKALKELKGQVAYNADDEVHFANLKVGSTLNFALANTTPARPARALQENGSNAPSAQEVDKQQQEELLKLFGLSHTIDTKVGDAYVRGVSGGERKRVSIAEVVAARAAVQLWDKSTRGLDANTALDYVKVMRVLADVERKAMAISLYQAGNAIYNKFDKVLVIAEGRCTYFGPRSEARGYFEDLGFEMMDGANVADFLTGVTALDERKVREGCEGEVPSTPKEFADLYAQSEMCQRMKAELQEHLADEAARQEEVSSVRTIVQREKHKRAFGKSPYGVSIFRQIKAALARETELRWADQFSFWQRLGSPVIVAFVVGSLFYQTPKTTGGIFMILGIQFLTIVYPAILTMAETTAAFESRAILAKHKSLSLYSPSAFIIAQSIADLPMYIVPLSIYAIILYFLTGLKMSAGGFFIYLLFLFITTCTMGSFFRLIGSAFPTFEDASKFSGFAFNLFATYSGYFIYINDMKAYLGWTRWINPLFYSWSSLAASQMAGQRFDCVPKQLVPYGPGYGNPENTGCAIAGAAPGELFVEGDAYLDTALSLSQSDVWRNFGIILALWIFFIILNILVTENLSAAGASSKGYLLFKRPSGKKAQDAVKSDEETGPAKASESSSRSRSEKQGDQEKESAAEQMAASSTFTWQNLTYTVKAGGSDRVLLQDVQGWCKPGQLTALMGSSGAGKTTLLDVLAQRKTSGEITGEVLIDGHALPVAFQRTTGYCEQIDIHMPQATVREALEFSALLRQPRTVSDKEKVAYVDTIVDLLELHDIEDAIIGQPGAGLSIEQRKRLTIGVELASKPRLLFADEPTSGLDGQSAFKIVKFLRKLADLGQSVLVTVHQPSASLFAEFDTLLLLKAGGKTVYFGPTADMPAYFAEHNFNFPKDANPAEHMIDIVSGELGKSQDWSDIWLQSKQHEDISEEVKRLKSAEANQNSREETKEDNYNFASATTYQMKLTLQRASVQMWRDTDYIVNKIMLHIATGLLNGFSFWMIDNTYNGLQRRLFTIFGFIFVAPGVIAQLQPKFLANRDLYERREKGSKTYAWKAFISAEILAEIPYLFVCGTLYFACWWATAGFSYAPGVAGPVILQIYIYELLYTGIGQAIAAYAPNATFAALVNPVIISILVTFNGAFVPYSQMQEFWKYWLYYLDPFKYLLGGLLVFPLWDQPVQCSAAELGRFAPPAGQTCGAYMSNFLSQNAGYLVDPNATDTCEYCIYSVGREYLADLNLPRHVYGWRDICITFLFACSSYALVFIMMKLRTKQTKTAKGKGK